MQSIIDQLNNSIANEFLNADCFVNYTDVKLAVSKLKLHKSEAGSGFLTNHLVYSGDDCFTHISLMLTSSIAHGRAPYCLCKSTIVPIPKGRNANLSDSTTETD